MIVCPGTDSNPVDHTYEDYSHQPNVAEMRAAAKLKRETEAGQPKERQRWVRFLRMVVMAATFTF